MTGGWTSKQVNGLLRRHGMLEDEGPRGRRKAGDEDEDEGMEEEGEGEEADESEGEGAEQLRGVSDEDLRGVWERLGGGLDSLRKVRVGGGGARYWERVGDRVNRGQACVWKH